MGRVAGLCHAVIASGAPESNPLMAMRIFRADSADLVARRTPGRQVASPPPLRGRVRVGGHQPSDIRSLQTPPPTGSTAGCALVSPTPPQGGSNGEVASEPKIRERRQTPSEEEARMAVDNPPLPAPAAKLETGLREGRRSHRQRPWRVQRGARRRDRPGRLNDYCAPAR